MDKTNELNHNQKSPIKGGFRGAGKEICEQLKEIRLQIAKENEIDYETSECTFEGECKGSCPRCDAELQYLENELHKRKHFGKKVAIAGVSLGMTLSMSACIMQGKPNDPLEDDITIRDTTKNVNDTTKYVRDTTDYEPPLMGIAPPPEEQQ
ncbi:MAG: hypothetical protein FWC39_11545 [Bacteroidetes bacterium]|nr:hypothetical protein [Bacteroidota bacterium]